MARIGKPSGKLWEALSLAAMIAAVGLGGCMPGCEDSDAPSRLGGSIRAADSAVEPSPLAEPGEGVTRYVVRGRVTGLPVAGDPRSDLSVYHEEVPNFMGSMEMPFPQVSQAVSLSGLAVGDPVEMTLDVTQEPFGYEVVQLRKLPPDTVLKLAE